MKFNGHTSQEWLNPAQMWETKAAKYGPDMESSKQHCLDMAKSCRLYAERARWHVGRVGRGKASRLFLYEDDIQVAQLKLEFGRLRVGKWFTSRSESKFECFCDSLSQVETIELLAKGV